MASMSFWGGRTGILCLRRLDRRQLDEQRGRSLTNQWEKEKVYGPEENPAIFLYGQIIQPMLYFSARSTWAISQSGVLSA